jgi:hypothetical protein
MVFILLRLDHWRVEASVRILWKPGVRNTRNFLELGVPLPPLYWLLLLLTLVCYLALTQVVKVWLLRKSWI